MILAYYWLNAMDQRDTMANLSGTLSCSPFSTSILIFQGMWSRHAMCFPRLTKPVITDVTKIMQVSIFVSMTVIIHSFRNKHRQITRNHAHIKYILFGLVFLTYDHDKI